MNEVELLDRMRGIAQLGLTYARDPYDIARYEELLKLAGEGYARVSGLAADEVVERFGREVGYVTPKVGVDGAIFSEDGTRVLLIRRADTGSWALPGGWAEVGQTSEASVARELREETTLTVAVGPVITVNSRLPGPERPHTSVHVLYHCTITDGAPQATSEAIEVAYRRPAEVTDWHADHGTWAAKALAWRKAQS